MTIPEKVLEIKNRIFPPVTWEVSKKDIILFAQAIGDSSPLWQDERCARKGRYGGLVAPPTFTDCLRHDDILNCIRELDIPQKQALIAGNELELFDPIRPGDTITVNAKLADVSEREGKKAGSMLFLSVELSYANQFGDAVARNRITMIRY